MAIINCYALINNKMANVIAHFDTYEEAVAERDRASRKGTIKAEDYDIVETTVAVND